jgi:hypothetical protein
MGARIVRKRGRPDLAFHHEQLARVIERLEQREAIGIISRVIVGEPALHKVCCVRTAIKKGDHFGMMIIPKLSSLR